MLHLVKNDAAFRVIAGRRFGAPVTTTWAALMETPS